MKVLFFFVKQKNAYSNKLNSKIVDEKFEGVQVNLLVKVSLIAYEIKSTNNQKNQ